MLSQEPGRGSRTWRAGGTCPHGLDATPADDSCYVQTARKLRLISATAVDRNCIDQMASARRRFQSKTDR